MLTFCFIRLNIHEVIRYHGHAVSIDAKFLGSFGTGIDQAQSMDFSRCKSEVGDSGVAFAWSLISRCDLGTVEVVPAIDQVIIRLWYLLRISYIHVFHLRSYAKY